MNYGNKSTLQNCGSDEEDDSLDNDNLRTKQDQKLIMDDYSDDEDDCPYTGNTKQEDINIDSEEEKENS